MNANRHDMPHWLSVLILLAMLTPARADLNWRTDYGKALKEAKESGKPLLVVVGNENCYWCKQLDSRTLSIAGVQKILNDRYIPFKLNADLQPDLAKALKVTVYPSIYFAASTGNIVGYQEGFVEADPLKNKLMQVLVAVGTPDWMARDYEAATAAIKEGNQPRALTLLRQVVEDGKSRTIQVKARTLIADLEKAARTQEERAKALADGGKSAEAIAELKKLDRAYPGTPAARSGKELMGRLMSKADTGEADNAATAKEMLEQARKDYRARQFLACLDRCEKIIVNYSDREEAVVANKMAKEIKTNPEWAKEMCDQLENRLVSLYLTQAEAARARGKPEQSMAYLERIVTMFPSSRHAETARRELARLKGPK